MEKMNTAWTRRNFLGSGITGAGALVVMPSAGLPALIGGGAPGRLLDPVLEQITSEMEAAVRMLQHQPSAEAMRRLASAFRLVTVWGKDKGADDLVRRRARDMVRSDGRSAMITSPVDLYEPLKARGLDVPPHASAVRATAAHREKALDELMANGITAQWALLASQFEARAAALDRRTGVVPVRFDHEDCDGARFMELLIEGSGILLTLLMVEFAVIMGLALFAWKAFSWYNGC